MPKHGMLIRITFVLAAAAAVSALAAAGAGAASAKHSSTSIKGAGSTFVAPLVTAWIGPAGSALGINLSYNPIGSGGGVSAITNKEVDFGASDAPLTQFSPTCGSCVQIPWALSATSVMYNLPGVKNGLKMSGPVLAKIYMGQIKSWNDSAIKKLNPGVNLPGTAITIVHRSDSSGTSFNFTDFLSRVSPSWKSKVGTGTSVAWPTGIGGKGSSGVSGLVHETKGAIGYADVAYSKKAHLSVFKMQNRSGKFIIPRLKNIKAASVLDTHPAPDGSLSIVNPPKSKKFATAYPICTYTYVDVQKSSPNAASIKKLLGWAVTKGQTFAPAHTFQPLPAAVVKFDQKQIAKIH
jgi:phosphate transport system substrate-binding protein